MKLYGLHSVHSSLLKPRPNVRIRRCFYKTNRLRSVESLDPPLPRPLPNPGRATVGYNSKELRDIILLVEMLGLAVTFVVCLCGALVLSVQRSSLGLWSSVTCLSMKSTESIRLTSYCALTLWRPMLPYGYSYKASRARSGWAVICNFWHFLRPECQSARVSKITNDGLALSGKGCFIAVPIWQQWTSKG